jgi:hypothetical protein
MKLVREQLYEKFKAESDPIQDLGIGLMSKFIKQLKRAAKTEDDIQYEYEQIIRRFHKKYPAFDWMKIFNELPEDALDDVPPNGGWPGLDEAFTDADSDPISDMGIGGFSYETLKPGAVLKAKRMGFAVTKNQSGQFTSWHSGLKLYPESYIVIYNVIRYGTNYKDLRFKKYNNKEQMDISRDYFKTHGNTTLYGGTNGRMIVSKKKFDYRFIVEERGF